MFKSQRFCGKVYAVNVRFCRSIRSNISGPMPDGTAAAAVVFSICMSWAEKLIARWDTIPQTGREGPKHGGLPFFVLTTIAGSVNKKSAIDHHCRRSQVLGGTRIFANFVDAYTCGHRVSWSVRQPDFTHRPAPAPTPMDNFPSACS